MTVRSMLAGGDRRSIGRADEVAAMLAREPERVEEAVECLWSDDACVRMRAADALEKVSREPTGMLQPFRDLLVGLMAEATQKEVRWHLALMVPRLALTEGQCQVVCEALKTYLEDHSSILKTFAMQGLADLTAQCPGLKPMVIDVVRVCTRSGTAAMRARGRILLRGLEA